MATKILWPLISNVIRRNKLSNTFGRFPERKSGTHWGWDFYATPGTPCFAIADGPIKAVYGSATDTGNFGLVVVQKFEYEGKELFAAYCHLSAALVQPSPNAIAAGTQIGMTGNSGNASTMKGDDQHLHFEIRSSVRPSPGGEPLRISPLKVFKVCPLSKPIVEP